MEQKCKELGLECAFPKPFCTLEPEKNKPTITRFINETAVGRPLLEISTPTIGKDEVIEHTAVRRSAPCGSTLYMARKLAGAPHEKRSFIRRNRQSAPQLSMHGNDGHRPRDQGADSTYRRFHDSRRSGKSIRKGSK
jgi:hypothetical protein